MAAEPILYSLFWQPLVNWRVAPVSLGISNPLRESNQVLAMVLYPALLTPAVHLRDDDVAKDKFEILISAAGTDVARVPFLVNHHLKVTLGLDPAKTPSYKPLFANPKDEITVQQVTPDGNGILRTQGGFRGIVHPTVKLPGVNPRFYAVQISASCLEEAAKRPARETVDLGYSGVPTETQDAFIHNQLLPRLNGPALRGDKGFGTHCFQVSGASVNLGMPDMDQPIRAYHPLFVYPKGGLGHASFGHASDLHLNARQQVLKQSDARVIDVDNDGVSPRIGSLLNVYSANFLSILGGLKEKGADVVLLGGDLIDHVKNCCPWPSGRVPASGEPKNAGQIWKLVDLDDSGNYATNYQAFVDHITVYSIVRSFCESWKTPTFVVSGNHDAYEEAYGMSPRVLGIKRANEGIAADHNLTFYEAILAFGESYGTIKKSFNFTPALFEWFYNVFTPFSDYAVELPKQRIVGLHWGEAEEMISAPFTGHGVGHLPRANKAATPAQVALLNDGFRSSKRTVLSTHFTFVSYEDKIPNYDSKKDPDHTHPARGETGFGSTAFGDHDFGTFEQQRQPLYTAAAASAKMLAVFTGHSHRKGLYYLGSPGSGCATEMLPIEPVGRRQLRLRRDETPIIVSDCAGPLPRLNYEDELRGWGSDRPAGTVLKVDEASGQPLSVVAVQATAINARPRLAVSLEYLHVLQKWYALTDEVFGTIETAEFLPGEALTAQHGMRIQLGRAFARIAYRIASIGLHCKPTVGGPWKGLTLRPDDLREGMVFKSDVGVAQVPRTSEQNATFMEWLTAPRGARFMSLTFGERRDAKPPQALGRYNLDSPWNFEVDAWGEDVLHLAHTARKYVIVPRFEAPNFEWRKKSPRYQA